MARSCSGYDEYEGIFGPLGVHGGGSSRYARGFSGAGRYGGGSGGGRSRSHRSPGNLGAFAHMRTSSIRDYASRSKYLTERRSKRRLKPFDVDIDAAEGVGDGEEEDNGKSPHPCPPGPLVSGSQRQVWLPTRNFSFRQRAGKLDTRAIARLDLERIVATTDIDTIQLHLENLAFADVTLEDVQHYSDAYFLKLFQIAQLTLEYLMNVQDSLVTHSEGIETQCEQLLEECQQLETENDTFEAEIVALKKDIRQKQRTLATFEVMLLNASASQRRICTSGSRFEKENAAVEANAIVDSLLGGPGVADGKEEGAIDAPVDCVLCSKKFLTAEYLIRHQQRKHRRHDRKKQKQKRLSGSPSPRSSSSDSDGSGSDSPNKKSRKTKKVKGGVKTVPLPAEVVKALEEKNELAKQLLQLQDQLQQEKDARDAQSKLLEGQQSQLTSQMVGNLSKLQEMLVEIEKKQEATKQDMMQYTQETITRLQHDAANAHSLKQSQSRAGRIESDEDEREKVNRSAAEKPRDDDAAERHEKQLEKVMEVFFKAQAQQQQEIDALAQENSKLWQKKNRQRQKRHQQNAAGASALLQMAALDARRFGSDHGEIAAVAPTLEEKPVLPLAVKAAVLEDKLVQTDDEEDRSADAKKARMSTHEVQTDTIPVPTESATPSTPAKLHEPIRKVTRKERKPVLPQPTAIPKPKRQPAAVTGEKETPVAVPEEKKPEDSSLAADPSDDSETRLQHAAHVVGKAALGFLTRKMLQNPANWLISLPFSALEVALSDDELKQLRAHVDGNSATTALVIEVEHGMTANELRVAIARGISGEIPKAATEEEDEKTGANRKVPMDYHRILLHHMETREELHGDRPIHALNNQIEVEVIPFHVAAEDHVADVFDLHSEVSDRLKEIKRASMELAPDFFDHLAAERERDDAAAAGDLKLSRLVRLQARVRGFLAKRKVESIKIDRLVDARIMKMRAASASTLRNQRSSPSSVNARTNSPDPVVVLQCKKVEQRLAAAIHDKVHQAGSGNSTRSTSRTRSATRLSSAAYEQHLQTLAQEQSKLPAKVQARIHSLHERLEQLVNTEYDPQKAKMHEQQMRAATKIQGAVQVALARKRLQTLLERVRGIQTASADDRDQGTSREEAPRSVSPLSPFSARRSGAAADDDGDGGDDSKPLEEKEHLDDFDAQEIEKLADAYEDGIAVAQSFALEDADEEEQPRAPAKEKSAPLAELVLDHKPVSRRTAATIPTSIMSPPLTPVPTPHESEVPQPRAGTPIRQVAADPGRSPRPTLEREVISPFSKTPLLSRRGGGGPAARRGSGYDNAR